MTAEAGWSAWPAPAKLNLFLQITGRRQDGYHTLQTVFRLLEWGDTLRLRIREDGGIVRHGASAPGVAEVDDLRTCGHLHGSARLNDSACLDDDDRW